MTEKLPRLSVVIPSYNQGQFIERTIRSIVDQDYPDLELILMDGGSNDATMDIVERYRAHFAHVQSQRDGGQTAAIADGFERATGEYISWLNSDDTYAPGALLAVGRALAAKPEINFIYGDAALIDTNDRQFAYKRSVRAIRGVMKYAFLTVPQMSAFWRRSLYEEVGGLDRSLRFCMDYDLFVRMAARSMPVRLNAHVGNFRIHTSSKTSTMEAVRQAEDRLVHQRYCAIKPDSIFFKPLRMAWTTVLIGLFIENGSLPERVARRLGNNMRSECS